MEDLFQLAEKVVNKARETKTILAVAESCTGGMVATALTSVAGSSDVFDRGFVTYSYEAKEELLGVNRNTLTKHGAVSENCVEEMALGAVKNSRAHVAVSISGIAGPGGGMKDKPVGLVFFSSFNKKKNIIKTESKTFAGDRHSVRVQSAKRALELFMVMLEY